VVTACGGSVRNHNPFAVDLGTTSSRNEPRDRALVLPGPARRQERGPVLDSIGEGSRAPSMLRQLQGVGPAAHSRVCIRGRREGAARTEEARRNKLVRKEVG
jgi:hypothetical protein